MTRRGSAKLRINSRESLGDEGLIGGGLVAEAGEQAGDGDVFVERLPVEAAAADSDLLALLCGGAYD